MLCSVRIAQHAHKSNPSRPLMRGILADRAVEDTWDRHATALFCFQYLEHPRDVLRKNTGRAQHVCTKKTQKTLRFSHRGVKNDKTHSILPPTWKKIGTLCTNAHVVLLERRHSGRTAVLPPHNRCARGCSAQRAGCVLLFPSTELQTIICHNTKISS